MSTKVTVGVVTDSTADIPQRMLDSFSILMVPALLIVDGKTYEDGRELSRSEFYAGLPQYTQPPTTATPSPAHFQTAYRRLFDQGIEDIISIHVASTLSGMHTSAAQAAHAFQGNVHIIDSGQVSLGLGFQAIEAAQAAQLGKPIDHVIEIVHQAQERVRVAALINTLEYLRRSGRVSWLKAGVGDLLRIKQLLGVRQGSINDLGKSRTFDHALRKLLQISDSWGDCQRLAVLHTGIQELALQIADTIKHQAATQPLVVEVTTIIGAHIGPGSIGLAALTT